MEHGPAARKVCSPPFLLDHLSLFRWYLDYDISLTGEKADHYTRRAIVLAFATFTEVKRLLLVADLLNSLKVCC